MGLIQEDSCARWRSQCLVCQLSPRAASAHTWPTAPSRSRWRRPARRPARPITTGARTRGSRPRKDHLSTFAADVDTASYTIARRKLERGHAAAGRASVRVEEFVNYFHYAFPEPARRHAVRRRDGRRAVAASARPRHPARRRRHQGEVGQPSASRRTSCSSSTSRARWQSPDKLDARQAVAAHPDRTTSSDGDTVVARHLRRLDTASCCRRPASSTSDRDPRRDRRARPPAARPRWRRASTSPTSRRWRASQPGAIVARDRVHRRRRQRRRAHARARSSRSSRAAPRKA